MSEANLYVIGNAAVSPWVLSLDPYTQAGAERAVTWQRRGQGQFDAPNYWRIVTIDELRELLPTMDRMPYTQEAWDAFVARINHHKENE